jgi:hypothetical protein
VSSPAGADVAVDEDFYVTTRNLAARPPAPSVPGR